MPEPTADDETHLVVDSERVHSYEENSWEATVAEVEVNVVAYGDPGAVVFHPGTSKRRCPGSTSPCVAAFLDVGLRTSAETALEHLWPVLRNDSRCFTHEAKHMDMATLFFRPGVVARDARFGASGTRRRRERHRPPPGPERLLQPAGLHRQEPAVDDYAVVAQTGADNVVDVGRTGSD